MEQIGRYKIIGEIGRGAMGVVYRAQDPAIGRIVAIKTIRLGDLVDPGERGRLHDRLFREAQSAGILSHPNIVTIYDISEEGDLAYIAMEFVEGPALDRMFGDGSLDGKQILEVLTQTAGALDYAHKRGIVHRDIKPANIMVQDRTTAKITDFGVAKIQSHQMTHAGAMVGTPSYMSPEQIQGQAVDGRSDQFSLGVIAYELLTGEKPFSADSLPELVFKVVKTSPSAVHQLNTTLGWAVDSVIQRALAKEPGDRYPTCSDFTFALENSCRSSKGWRPNSPGVAQNLPTIAALPSSQPSKAMEEPVEVSPAPTGPPAPAVDPVWWVLRAARAIAIATLALGTVAALVIGGLQYFGSDDEGDQPSNTRAEYGSDRPSPTAPVAPQPAPSKSPSSERSGVSPPLARRTESPTTQTRVVTNPAGALIAVDGHPEWTCQSPCTLALPLGRHTVIVSLDGYRRNRRVLDLPGDDEVFLSLERITGTLMVRSEPRGAVIYLNGQARSEKTPAILNLPVGSYTVELDRDGRREKQEVVVRDSTITNVAISFDN